MYLLTAFSRSSKSTSKKSFLDLPSSCELKRGASAHIISNQIESIRHMNMGLQFHLREDRGRDCLVVDPLSDLLVWKRIMNRNENQFRAEQE